MVHNGVEYGMMAAIAEGLSIIKHANAGTVDRTVDAETTPLRDPWAYQYTSTSARSPKCGGADRWSASWLVDLIADAMARSPRARRFHRAGVGFRGGPVDGACRGGRGCAGPGDHHVALRAVPVASNSASSPTRSCRRCAANSAATPRRSSRHDRTGDHASRCAGDLRYHGRSGQEDDVPVAVPAGASRPARLPDRRGRPRRLVGGGAARSCPPGDRERRRNDRRGRVRTIREEAIDGLGRFRRRENL